MTAQAPAEPAERAPAYNLLDEPWLPVRYLDGSTETLGLLALFERAAQIEGLAETSPPNLVAMKRLLLAITHRALSRRLGRWTDRDRAGWHAQGLPGGVVADYLMHWRDRFWLFHNDHPFMQVAALASAAETRDKLKPWTQVALSSANGDTPVVFDHAIDRKPVAVDAAEVLRHMLGFQQFVPGGLVQVFKVADKGGPLANAAAAIPVGDSLLQSLLLALHPAPDEQGHDLPAWERPAVAVAQLLADPKPATGCCDRYTRLSRAVLLLPDQAASRPSVRWLRFGAGTALLEDDNAPDPMASFRPGSDGLVRMGFTEGRAMWRDLGALLPDVTGKLAQPAAVLNWAANLHVARNAWDADQAVMLAGLCSNKAKLVRWRAELYRLPVSSLSEADLGAAVRNQLQRCDDLFYPLRTLAADLLAQTMPDPSSKDTRARARAVLDASPFGPTFFAAAERRLPRLLALLGTTELAAAHLEWSAALLQAAQGAWAAARAMLGTSGTALRADALTHGRFLALIHPLRPAIAPPHLAKEATP
jgi:CRISPR system Cascade subunit CasA